MDRRSRREFPKASLGAGGIGLLFGNALAAIARDRPGALIVTGEVIFVSRRSRSSTSWRPAHCRRYTSTERRRTPGA